MNTDINNPNSDTYGSKVKHGEPILATEDYKVTNNRTATVTMEGTYHVTDPGDISLVDEVDVSEKGGDCKIDLALDLNYGTQDPNDPFIANVKDNASSSQAINLTGGSSVKLQFDSDTQGMSDVK